MRLLTRFLAGLLVLVLLLGAGAFLLPRDIAVQRSVVIDAPPEDVFAHVSSLQAFAEWSPWAELDPGMKQEFTGPDSGVGNKMTWESDDPGVGSGTQEIIEIKENERVATSLDFGPMGQGAAQWMLAAKDGGTEITWAFQTDMGMNPIARYMGLMMDGWIGKDYEKGLEKLKARVEGG